MSAVVTRSSAPDRLAKFSRLEIRGGWALVGALFLPFLIMQVLLAFWSQLFPLVAGLFGNDPFPVYMWMSLVSRIGLLLIVASGIARALVAAAGIHMRHQRVKEYFRTTQIPSTIVKDRLTALQAYKLPFVVYGDPVPRAFVLGILKTRIYLSTGLLDTLDDRELGSVIMHEVHHHRNRDPLKGFVLSILSHLFFYVPVIRSYADFWQQHREWEADAAARRVSDATSLAHALCKLLTTSPTISGAGGGFALSGGSGSVASPALHGMGNIRERIELLLDLRPTRPWALGAREFGTSVACLTLLGVLSLGLFSPVKMDVSNLLSQPVARTDAMGWVVPQRVDTFWVPPFQGAHQRVRYVGIDPHTAPPSSSHQAQR